MSRKPPTDTFTRFTSTTPSSSSGPSFTAVPPSSSSNTPSSQNPNETPADRVARLRAQHAANRASSISTTDRVLARGRRFADVAHRATTYTLLGFSAVATVVAAYGVVSLINHNRTQKRAWIERELDRLEGARAAFLKGQADAEQLHLLEQERAGEVLKERHEEEKRRRKWSTKIKGLFGGGEGDMGVGETLRERGERIRRGNEEALGGNVSPGLQSQSQAQAQTQRFRMGDAEVELRPAAVEGSAVAGVGLDDKGRPVPINKMEQRVVQSQTQQTPPPSSSIDLVVVPNRSGGPLDQLAANVSTGASSAGSSLWSSIFGGGASRS